MNKIRGLSLVCLAVCIATFTVGFHYSNFELKDSVGNILWGALALASGYGIIGAIGVTLLSFLALKPEPDGSFIVDRESLYGRLFLSCIGTTYQDQFSLCEAFWKTNGLLFIISLVIGMIVFVAIVVIEAGLKNCLILIAGLILVALFIALFVSGLMKAGEVFYKFERKHRVAAERIREIPIYISVMIFFSGISLFAYAIYSNWSAILLWCFMWIPLIAYWCMLFTIALAAFYGLYKIVEATIGEEFSSFYHENLCPRIKIR